MKRKIPEKPAADRRQVLSLRAHGMSIGLIAKRMGCSVEELENQYARELERALPEMRAKVGGSLFAAAQSGDIRAIIFWLKTRARWRETDHKEATLVERPPRRTILYPPAFLPCNGRALCLKIPDPRERRDYYERILQRKLPAFDPDACPTSFSNEERHLRWELVLAAIDRWQTKR